MGRGEQASLLDGKEAVMLDEVLDLFENDPRLFVRSFAPKDGKWSDLLAEAVDVSETGRLNLPDYTEEERALAASRFERARKTREERERLERCNATMPHRTTRSEGRLPSHWECVGNLHEIEPKAKRALEALEDHSSTAMVFEAFPELLGDLESLRTCFRELFQRGSRLDTLLTDLIGEELPNSGGTASCPRQKGAPWVT